jgi:hypothetical protein
MFKNTQKINYNEYSHKLVCMCVFLEINGKMRSLT